MKTSSFLTLNIRDFLKGLLMAVLGSVFAIIKTTIEAGSLSLDWPVIGKYALVAACTYLAKNLFTNSKDEFAHKEP